MAYFSNPWYLPSPPEYPSNGDRGDQSNGSGNRRARLPLFLNPYYSTGSRDRNGVADRPVAPTIPVYITPEVPLQLAVPYYREFSFESCDCYFCSHMRYDTRGDNLPGNDNAREGVGWSQDFEVGGNKFMSYVRSRSGYRSKSYDVKVKRKVPPRERRRWKMYPYSINQLWATIPPPPPPTGVTLFWRAPEKIDPENEKLAERRQYWPNDQGLVGRTRARARGFRYNYGEPGRDRDLSRTSEDPETLDMDELKWRATLIMSAVIPYGDIKGCGLLNVWKSTAGRSKSWRRCPKAIDSTLPRQSPAASKRFGAIHESVKVSCWAPATFRRSMQRREHSHSMRESQRQAPTPQKKYKEHIDLEDSYVDKNAEIPVQTRPLSRHISWSTTEPLIPEILDDSGVEPGKPFIRLSWKDKTIVNGGGQLDRFLPDDLTFHSGWCITGFIRNENHADVYSLRTTGDHPVDAVAKTNLEAHIFLDEYHGNSENYAKRQKSRMRSSGNCLDSFWYANRHILVMRVTRQPEQFKLRNNEEEFPFLVGRTQCIAHIALQRRSFRGKPSFAAVARGVPSRADVAVASISAPQYKTALEKELEQIEKARIKKKERQRCKRQASRIAKREERDWLAQSSSQSADKGA